MVLGKAPSEIRQYQWELEVGHNKIYFQRWCRSVVLFVLQLNVN